MEIIYYETPENQNLFESLEIAARLGLEFVARRALQSPTLSYRYTRALFYAIKRRDENILQTILEARKIDGLDGFVRMAVEEGRGNDIDALRIVRLLVEHGAGSQGLRPALIIAANRDLYHVVHFFVDDCGTDIRSPLDNGNSILCSLNTLFGYNEQILSYLFERGVDLNGVPGNSDTPLEVAILKQSLTIVKFLLEHRADVNLSGSSDRGSPLYRVLQTPWYTSKVEEHDNPDHILELLNSKWSRDCLIQMLLTAGAETNGLPEELLEQLLECNNRQK